MMKLYLLADRQVVACPDTLTWARGIGKLDRRVAGTLIGPVRVSTVFLGIDHRFGGKGPPLVFETVIFGGIHDGEMWRYSSWDDAETGHAQAVKRVRRFCS
jgi:hypothetical protein